MSFTAAIQKVASYFALEGGVVAVKRLGGGHINDSWRVTTATGSEKQQYLLQRINDRVFPHPELVMENIDRVTVHTSAALEREAIADSCRRTLTLVRTRTGAHSHVDESGSYWRVFLFVERTVSHERATSPDLAYQAARTFGEFQRILHDLPGPRLHETIRSFHDTPQRVAALERAIAADAHNRCDEARPEIELALSFRALAPALLAAHDRGEIPERVVHNDAKISNVLFDVNTDEGLCIVDLDTVMPGLALYDFGDMARSMATRAAEDETDLSAVTVEPDLFEGVARGYLDGTRDLLARAERDLLVTAARVITFEQGVRFLTDFLDGDRYYGVARPNHNLERCRTQLALLVAMTRAEAELSKLIRG